MEPEAPRKFSDALKISDIRFFILAVAFSTLASRALLVVIGFQIYRLTHSALALGWLGLVEAVPAISLVLFGGYTADRYNRRNILLYTRAFSCLCGGLLVYFSMLSGASALFGLYGVIFFSGVARSFADPASAAFEAQIVPRHLTVNASSWISSVWLSCSVLGPAAIGFVFEAWGPVGSYTIITSWYILAWFSTLFISDKFQEVPKEREDMLKSISLGWNFVFKSQPLSAAMMLDLLAVLFGGAVALLPIYADDILHVGARGLGFLNAATALGAVLVSLMATHRPPIAQAGRNLILTVVGFGLSMIAFAFSKNFWLSMAALFMSGIFDGISVVIRRSMMRLLSPNHLRGRIAATNSIFIVASNELGAFESGFVAAWIGVVPCVAVGGALTLGVAAMAAVFAPQLRNLRFNPRTLEQGK